MNGILERISELEQVLAQAVQVESEVKDQKATLAATQAQVDQIVRDLQERIKNGESSGDTAMDIKIMLHGSVTKDAVYNRLSWLKNLVETNAGELILVIGSSFMSWTLAVLPEEPTLLWEKDWRAEFVNIPVAASCTGSSLFGGSREGSPEPIKIAFNVIDRYEIDRPKEDRKGFHGDLEIIVGMEAIQSKVQEMRIHEAFQAWVRARVLGKPLELYPELARELRDRREKRVVELLEAMRELKELTDRLKHFKQHPIEGMKQYMPTYRVTMQETPGGVAIDFGLTPPIEAATDKLRKLVEPAIVELEMSDNPTLQQAAKVLGIQLEEYQADTVDTLDD